MTASIMESLKNTIIPATLSAGAGAAIVYMGRTCAPFVMTSVPHAALFSAGASLVANAVSPLFAKLNIGQKTNTALSYLTGASVALIVSVGAAYFGLTASAVSLAGVIALTISALAVSLIFERLRVMNRCFA